MAEAVTVAVGRQEDGVVLIELNRPEAMNALSERVFDELAAALQEAEAPDCRGVVFCGAGDRAFCAGADLAQLQRRGQAEHRRNARRGQGLFDRIQALAVPSVAVLHGHALGGGLELALACTFRIASPRARLGLPEVRLGLMPGYGGTQRLPRLIGASRALSLMLSGRVIDAEEALGLGLVDALVQVESPAEAGRRFLAPFLSSSPVAVRHAMEAVRRGLAGGLADGLAIEADIFALCAQSEDAAEGVAAFLEKRPPVFPGR